jgi:hypothetical protein
VSQERTVTTESVVTVVATTVDVDVARVADTVARERL